MFCSLLIILRPWCKSGAWRAGALSEYPLMDWIDGERYLTRVLIITGDSGKGKTQIAKAMLARFAEEKQAGVYPLARPARGGGTPFLRAPRTQWKKEA